MKLTVPREAIMPSLQAVNGVVEKRQTLPILANILVNVTPEGLTFTGTDLEVEVSSHVALPMDVQGDFTLPARKFYDICKTLPDDAVLDLDVQETQVVLKSGRSRFSLSTLPASNYPNLDPIESATEFTVQERVLKFLFDKTAFSMANQDVRYYLNGLLLELYEDMLRVVATDGHRLAFCQTRHVSEVSNLPASTHQQIIVPRKAVSELSRLLDSSETEIKVQLSSNHIRLHLPDIVFSSKLIDGRFPDYNRVIPQAGNKIILCDREVLRQSLVRAAVLSTDKFRAARLEVEPNKFRILVHNPEQEEAEEELEVNYQGESFVIGFNVAYLLDVLTVIESEYVRLTMTDSNSSCLIESAETTACKYVVMPMRL